MEFRLENTREQALLAMIVQEAEQVIEKKGNCYLGRTSMQKLPYFLQVCGVPCRYRFNVHHYGPFCSDILSDLEWLCVLDVVKDTSTNKEKYSNYRPGDSAQNVTEEFEAELEEHRETIRQVVEALHPWNPERLELVSTLHYAYRELRAANETPTFSDVVERFREYKQDKFEDSDIKTTLQTMKDVGLVSVTA